MNDIVVLGLLFDGPKHGYQLKREAGFVLGRGDMHNNLVYPLLRRLTTEGWVTKKTVPGDRGQTRHRYALTAKGRHELIRRLVEYSDEDARSDQAFNTRVGMFGLVGPDARARILGKREAYLNAREARLDILKTSIDVGTYGAEVIGFLWRQTRSEIVWIERLRRMHRDQK
jgi:DNA-binding PadR family transcriptional regulator